jgi:Zn-dependent protease with chaperone function
MIVVMAAAVASAIALPHCLDLRRAAPTTAVVFWLSSLALRALAGAMGVAYMLFFFPRTGAYHAVTHMSFDTVVPVLGIQVEINGHSAGDVALFVPGLALAGSAFAVCVGTAREALAVRRMVDRHAVGEGPRSSVIVSGPEVMFAVAGLVRPRVVVSAGALVSLDDDELSAALDHEQGHIARGHRFVLLVALALRALGRPLPGAQRAIGELAFHLERDADAWALRRRGDRLALASALTKAAVIGGRESCDAATPRALGVHERRNQLLRHQPHRGSLRVAAALNGLAVIMVTCTLILAALVPRTAVAGARNDPHGTHVEHPH